MPMRRSSPGAGRGRAAGGSCCASRTSTPGRCREEFVAAHRRGSRLARARLGRRGAAPVAPSRRLSRRARPARRQAGLVYPCFCTRAAIAAEIARALDAPHGPEGPRLSRHLPGAGARRAARRGWQRASPSRSASTWRWRWREPGRSNGRTRRAGTVAADPLALGDVVLARKDAPTSYHLAVTVDDALQGVTPGDARRGSASPRPTSIACCRRCSDWLRRAIATIRCSTDAHGRRYAKRDRALTLRALREAGHTPDEVRAMAAIAAT